MTQTYGAMQEVQWYSAKIMDLPISEEEGPHVTDACVDLALGVYANWVVDDTSIHYFAPYLQVENGCELWIHVQLFIVSAPDSGVLKRHVLRDYIVRGEQARLDDLGWMEWRLEDIEDAVEGVCD